MTEWVHEWTKIKKIEIYSIKLSKLNKLGLRGIKTAKF